ncbi:MAG: hypothetical protein JNK82_40440 [Myxococcaceae bacterium]|nr:hypothetical protein [Myxococcaceae bacterium]
MAWVLREAERYFGGQAVSKRFAERLGLHRKQQMACVCDNHCMPIGGVTAAPSPRPQPTEDIAVPARHKADTVWARPTGQLVRDGFGADDPIQGGLGDCYLVSGLSALANVRPDVLRDAIRQNPDGTFTVRFYKDSFLGLFGKSKKPVYVTVDGTLPTKDGSKPRYARGRDVQELWPAIVEKAYAKLDGGYDKVAKGGSPATLWQALTGRSGSMQLTAFKSGSRLFDDMKNALAEKRPVAASTNPVATKKYQDSGLSGKHVYAVLAVYERGGEKYVRMRNPWGYGEPGSDGRDDGVFELTIDAFKKKFPLSYYGG